MPQPSAERLTSHYPSGYYGEGRRYGKVLEFFLRRLYSARAHTLNAQNGHRPGRVLDIGCGRGILLSELRRRGWLAMGTELSDESAAFARSVLGLDVRVEALNELDLTDQSFDLIVLWHVLEHVPDPGSLLQEIAYLLKPGGTLFLAVPNFGSIEARLARGAWFHLDVPRHLTHFTRGTLETLLREADLVPNRATFFSLEYDVFSALQTTLNVFGIQKNTLFNVLRARRAKVLGTQSGRKSEALDVLLSLLLAPVLGAAGFLWAPLASLLKQGGTVTVYARRSD